MYTLKLKVNLQLKLILTELRTLRYRVLVCYYFT